MVICFRLVQALLYQEGPLDPIVYRADDTGLSVIPVAYAMALIVVVAFTGTGLL